jgi:3-hydroxyacyl-[acyl-carrier-protein] dehydratase
MIESFTDKLYTVLSKDGMNVSVRFTDSSHPIFKAHFEGNPLLPAFLQVDIAAEILGFSVQGISRSKFMEPLLPDDEVVLEHEERAGKIRVRWVKNGKIASEITLEVE